MSVLEYQKPPEPKRFSWSPCIVMWLACALMLSLFDDPISGMIVSLLPASTFFLTAWLAHFRLHRVWINHARLATFICGFLSCIAAGGTAMLFPGIASEISGLTVLALLPPCSVFFLTLGKPLSD